MNQREKAALDNHITGHYGEDQYKEEKPEWRTYKQWRDLFPTALFELHNQGEKIEDYFNARQINLITEMLPSIIDEVANELWFDTIRFNLDSLSKREIVSLIFELYADTITLSDDEDHCNIEAWWD
jgi:hypothetical protein